MANSELSPQQASYIEACKSAWLTGVFLADLVEFAKETQEKTIEPPGFARQES